jgi:hypothetical protein
VPPIDGSALWSIRYRLDDLIIGRLIEELTWHLLDLAVPHQEQANWCWAATGDGVAHYYDKTSTWTQCLIANANLNRSDCCGNGASGPCNVYGFLNDALTAVGHYDHMAAQVASFQVVEGEVGAGRPLGVRVAWSGGGAHFLAIGGFRDLPDNYLHVEDPWYGPSDIAHATLESAYQGSGKWTHTYWTKV